MGESENWLKWSRDEIENIYEWMMELENRHPGILQKANQQYRPGFLTAVMEIKRRNPEFANLFCEYERLRNVMLDSQAHWWENCPEACWCHSDSDHARCPNHCHDVTYDYDDY